MTNGCGRNRKLSFLAGWQLAVDGNGFGIGIFVLNHAASLIRWKMISVSHNIGYESMFCGAFGRVCGSAAIKIAAGEASAHLANTTSGIISLLNVAVLVEIGTYSSFHYFGLLLKLWSARFIHGTLPPN